MARKKPPPQQKVASAAYGVAATSQQSTYPPRPSSNSSAATFIISTTPHHQQVLNASSTRGRFFARPPAWHGPQLSNGSDPLRRVHSGRMQKKRRNNITLEGHRRKKPGQKALQEIRYYKNSTKLLLRKLPFVRLCRELLQKIDPSGRIFRFTATALMAMQEAAEAYAVCLLELSNLCALHCGRITLKTTDMHLVAELTGVTNMRQFFTVPV